MKLGTPAAAEPPPTPPPPEPATPAPARAKSRRRFLRLTDAELAERVATLARAREMFPAVFGDEPKPLAIGTGAKLRNALSVSAQAIDLAMVWWVTRPSYTRAVAAPGSKQWNLDGTVAEDVSAEHRADATDALSHPGQKRDPQQKKQRERTIMSATVQARSIKATVVLDASEITRIPIPNSVARVALRIEVDGRALTADLNAKSVRKCIAVIEAAGSTGANVVLQGKLDAAGTTLLEAGIVATPKTPKPATGEAVAA